MKKFVFTLILCFLLIPVVNASQVVSCGTTEAIPAKIVDLIRFAFKLIKYAVPIVLIVMGSIDLFKYITGSDSDMLSKYMKSFVKKLVAGALVFLLILLFQIIIRLVTNEGGITECISCFLVDKDSCTYYEKEDKDDGDKDVTSGVKDNETDFDEPSEDPTITSGGKHAGTCPQENESVPTGFDTVEIVSVSVSKNVIGCDVKADNTDNTLTTIQINSILADEVVEIFKDICKYINNDAVAKSITGGVIRFGNSYRPTSGDTKQKGDPCWPHRYATGMDIYVNWTFGDLSYAPYALYSDSEYARYKSFICGIGKGKEDSKYNLNYQIYKNAFQNKKHTWCWGGNWGKSSFDPMHFEMLKPGNSSCSTSNKVPITCN